VIDVAVTNQQSSLRIDAVRLKTAAEGVLKAAGLASATVSIAVVDDAVIRDLNRRYLQHDYATDVLSFVLEQDEQRLEGEIVVSADTAVSACGRYAWSAADELLLYVVHGTLHLVGYDDGTEAERAAMRAEERRHLGRFDLRPRYDEDRCSADPDTNRRGKDDPPEGGGRL
jgi:probable rRNA maturation factor